MSQTQAQPLKFEKPDEGEETARADLYGLLATLLYAPPSQALLDTIGSAQTQGEGVLERAWAELVGACRTADEETVRAEYEQLFLGTGKPEVILYGSYYLAGFLMEKPLVELRDDLARLGLQRVESMPESEDHLAALCEVMRYLIASDDLAHANLDTQKSFFAAHMQPWVQDCCTALAVHPSALFYKPVAALAQAFLDVEMQAFDMA
ncbi:molecular chaperone [Lacisediminimonas sp.]|uniref:TorD/DmsD family molecular chaperone n=1 Tax=Lacisediminimonas sp. TaxID=3060582 RepID=UPI00272302FA|nr:molecular chaperone TorD family protein [Lacisediminimonas sp.]MDO8298446.1 molecular chaperone TorD family protein [Lacisediminimonas sp.]